MILAMSLFLIMMAGCREGVPGKPLKFVAYEHNPILTPGEPGAWDETYVGAPYIICHEGIKYLFYLGHNASIKMSVGLAISRDGLHFTKYGGNPILSPDGKGFDAMQASPGRVLKMDSIWAMYYNGQELVVYSPGAYIGRATAKQLTGPWTSDEKPILSGGNRGEWDAGFIIPSSVLALEDGTYRLYYTGGTDLLQWGGFFVGMASSSDGIHWKKYNDPATTKHPFAESDPVMMTGRKGEWDGSDLWIPHVVKVSGGYRMFYGGTPEDANSESNEMSAIGFATSADGIHWEKYADNPVLQSSDDPHFTKKGSTGGIENPWVFYTDSAWFLYYDYTNAPGGIALATAKMK
jgi:predicted GH43/DUF377 family glycosyl hydrolase